MSQLVSIIIPVHKTHEYFKESVLSALNQSYNSIEVILACNKKITIESCKQFLNIEDDRLVFIKTSDGRHNARNEALKISRGYYIQFLDYDDLLHESKLESQIKLLEKYDENAICITKWKKFSKKINEHYNFPFEDLFKENYIDYRLLLKKLGKHGGFLATISFLFPKNVIKDIKWVETPNDDAVFFSQLCSKNPKIVMDNQILAGYRIHADNTSSLRDNESLDSLLVSWTLIYTNLKSIIDKDIHLYLFRAYLYLIKYSKSINCYKLPLILINSVKHGIKARKFNFVKLIFLHLKG